MERLILTQGRGHKLNFLTNNQGRVSLNSDFEMLVAFNGRLSPSSGLYSRQTVPAMSIDTLTITTVAQLFRWDTLAVAVRSDTSFQVLKDSTFSAVMHGRLMAFLRGE